MLATWTKAPDERKRYTIDYSEWLGTSEHLSTFDLDPGTATVVVSGAAIDDAVQKHLIFFVEGGASNERAIVTVTVTTTDGQIKQDVFTIQVRDPK